MILHVAVAVLGIYSAAITAAIIYANYKRARGKALMRGLFDELDGQLDEGEIVSPAEEAEYAAHREAIMKGDGWNQDPAEARESFRDAIRIGLADAVENLEEAERLGRRTDCLRQVVEGYRGALRNICHEDGVEFVEPESP